MSGGIHLENVSEIAGTGVQRISIGALTHSAPAADIALEIAPVTERERDDEASTPGGVVA